jgi:hypothetical protein
VHWGQGASNQRITDALRAQLASNQEELEASKKELNSFGNLTFIQRYFENDFVHFVNIYFVSEDIVRKLNGTNSALLITAATDTQPLADYIYDSIYNTLTILRTDQQHPDIKNPTVRPPKDTDLDAPKLSLPDFNGIAVYGADERMQEMLADMFSRIKPCFLVKYSQHTPAEITDYYKQPVVWIAIGHMPLWREQPCR